jgi:RNA polymerase sigma factor (TIGR02999 family)
MDRAMRSLNRPTRWTTRTYSNLRRIAARCLADEYRSPTLSPTELLHQTWLRLRNSEEPSAGYRVGLAVHAMREVLVDLARRRNAAKRSGQRIPLSQAEGHAAAERDAYVVALDSALAELAAWSPELARIVELRFFGGFELEAVAAELGLSSRTVKRRWQLAKGWLHQRITES